MIKNNTKIMIDPNALLDEEEIKQKAKKKRKTVLSNIICSYLDAKIRHKKVREGD